MMRRPAPVATPLALVTVVLIIAGCGASSTSDHITSSAATPPTPPQASSPNEIIGFGATRSAWDAHHRADPTAQRGSAYDPDPSLGTTHGDTYFDVSGDAGRVDHYQMQFKPGTSIAEARRIVRAEFPLDAKVRWFAVKDSCAQTLIKSRRLGRALRGASIGDAAGTALVESTSGTAGDEYNARSVTGAIFILAGDEPPSRAGAC